MPPGVRRSCAQRKGLIQNQDHQENSTPLPLQQQATFSTELIFNVLKRDQETRFKKEWLIVHVLLTVRHMDYIVTNLHVLIRC